MDNQNNNFQGQQNKGDSINKGDQQDQLNKKNAGNVSGQSVDKKNLSKPGDVSGQEQE